MVTTRYNWRLTGATFYQVQLSLQRSRSSPLEKWVLPSDWLPAPSGREMAVRLAMFAVLLPLSDGLLISQQPRLRPGCLAAASLRPSCRPCFMKDGEAKGAAVEPLPSTLLPITLSVFAQMLGEGIAISSLPLYMTNLGASPTQVGLATSCFSAAQMVCCPLLVSLSSRVGRALVLRVCLIGATASSLLIAGSGSISGILLGRLFAGIFAASVPVAQSAATDVVSRPQTLGCQGQG